MSDPKQLKQPLILKVTPGMRLTAEDQMELLANSPEGQRMLAEALKLKTASELYRKTTNKKVL